MNGKLYPNHAMKRYMTGLDGLRAISVLAVIAYHLHLKWAQGGLLGVEIFFVISGYLITDQLLYEWKTFGRISLLQFWVKRMRRLLPAMLGMLLVVAMWLLLTDPSRLISLKGDFFTSIFYINNWYLIFHDVSYFESFGPPSPIGHLWSLAIEEQFYILWPLVLLIGIFLAPRRGKLTLLILIGAAVSAAAMAILYEPGSDPSRVYYGTDTRAFAILIGAALAVLWPSSKLNSHISSPARNVLGTLGVIGIALLLIQIHQTNEYDDALYPTGFIYLSILTAIVIAVLVHPANRLEKIMGCRPLSWIGKRSYSLYIWHYPVIILSSPEVNTEDVSYTRIILQLAVSLVMAAISYKYIEEPIRRKTLRGYLYSIRRSGYGSQLGLVAAMMITTVILASWLMGWQGWNSSSSASPVIDSTISSQEAVQPQSLQYDPAKETNQAMPADPVTKDSSGSGEGITAIGDSVILDAAPFLEKKLPGIVIDGKVGRQMTQVDDVIDSLKSQGKLGQTLIIELGTNGVFNETQLRSLLTSLQDTRQIYLVNTRVPRDWQDRVNASIQKVADDFHNVQVIDWYTASANKDQFFYQDGVHLKPEGAEYYASLLADTLQQNHTY
ncbi:acyltransferase family protein [Paenibacillus bovis]|uniref:Acyltransferase n=1 Tax=Paenibacillus bovis TaxID=1616788 RepID=A0A172ZHF1_9BACL|nr:acyltransferase family protein [Paenibacillus bovis]ANF97064.1 acyltransferase [Paenibacillus bovis]